MADTTPYHGKYDGKKPHIPGCKNCKVKKCKDCPIYNAFITSNDDT